jgi:hypothetical protein
MSIPILFPRLTTFFLTCRAGYVPRRGPSPCGASFQLARRRRQVTNLPHAERALSGATASPAGSASPVTPSGLTKKARKDVPRLFLPLTSLPYLHPLVSALAARPQRPLSREHIAEISSLVQPGWACATPIAITTNAITVTTNAYFITAHSHLSQRAPRKASTTCSDYRRSARER